MSKLYIYTINPSVASGRRKTESLERLPNRPPSATWAPKRLPNRTPSAAWAPSRALRAPSWAVRAPNQAVRAPKLGSNKAFRAPTWRPSAFQVIARALKTIEKCCTVDKFRGSCSFALQALTRRHSRPIWTLLEPNWK